jgi:hypothetical protein
MEVYLPEEERGAAVAASGRRRIERERFRDVLVDAGAARGV